MRARLGFAIATSVDPDILLLDEVLATGDAEFRAKSKARVIELVNAAKGIVLVTHDMAWVEEYCNRAILLEKGRVVIQRDPAEVVRTHIEHSAARKAERAARLGRDDRAGAGWGRHDDLRTVAAGLARRVARVRPAIRDAEAALEANDPERALEVTDAAIRARPGDRVLLAVRRRAFAARGDQTGVAATIAAQRRAGSDDNHALAVTERRLHGDLAETDPRWRPRLLGPRQPIEPRSDRVVLHLLKESRPQRQNGFTMRSHDNLLAQRAAGWEPLVVTALGFPRWSGASVTATEQVDGIRHHRIDLGAGYPANGPVDRYLEDYAWRASVIAREERPAIIHASSGGRGYESALVGLALGDHFNLPVVYEVRSLFDGPAPAGAGGPAADATSPRERYRRRDATEVRSMLAADAVVTLAETMKADMGARRARGPGPRRPQRRRPRGVLPMPPDPLLAPSTGWGIAT